ncbi:MAG: hypothetical protein AAB922_07685, partial [Patescibacteria group bacterium]
APNRLDTFLDPGQTGTYLALGLLFFTASNFIRSKKEVSLLFYTLIASISLLAVITLVHFSGFQPAWWPAVFPATAISVLSVFIPVLVFLGVQLFKTKSILLAVSLALILAASGLLIYRSDRPIFLAPITSWAIALETLKISPLVGVGPGSYPAAFTQYRPIAFNLTPQWDLRFTTAGNYYLHLLTTLGAVGLAAYLFLVLRVYTTLAKTKTIASPALAAILAVFISQLFLPAYLISTAVLFFLLILAVAALKTGGSSVVHESNIDIVATNSSTAILPILTLVIITSLAIPSAYFAARAYAAEVKFQKALQFAAANDGKNTYDTLISAIATNPYRDTYRIA